MSSMTEFERMEALERQVEDLTGRLARSQEQTAHAIANTDRSIQQTADALEQAQRFMKLYHDAIGKRSDAAGDEPKNAD